MSSQASRSLSSIREYQYEKYEDNNFLLIASSTKSTRSDWLTAATTIVEDPAYALNQLDNLDLFERTLFNIKLTGGETALKAYRILLNAPQLNKMNRTQLEGFDIAENLLFMMRPDPNNATHEEFEKRTELFYETAPGQKLLASLREASRAAS